MNAGVWIVGADGDNALLSTGEAGAAVSVIRYESEDTSSKRRIRIPACISAGIRLLVCRKMARISSA